MPYLTTLERVKAELRLAGTADDEFLTGLIGDASDALARWAGRSFQRARAEDGLAGYGGRFLSLPRTPVRLIFAIKRVVPGGADQTLPATSYQLLDAGLGTLVRFDGVWDWTADATAGLIPRTRSGSELPLWRVDYEGGWALPGAADRDLPAAIERACLETVKVAWFARLRDPNLTSESADDLYQGSWRQDNPHFLPAIARALVPRRFG